MFNENKVFHLETVDHSCSEVSKSFYDLKWSLNPLLVWAKLSAVLQLKNSNGSCKSAGSTFSLIYRYLSWFLTIISHSFRLYAFLSSDSLHLFSTGTKPEAGIYNKITFNWTLLIENTAKFLHSIIINTIIVFIFPRSFKILLDFMEKTEDSCYGLPSQLNYVFLRKISWSFVLYLFLSVKIITYKIRN